MQLTQDFLTLLNRNSSSGRITVFLIGLAFILNSCGPEVFDIPEPPTTGNITINFIHHIDGVDLELDKRIYENGAGNKYAITRLQYYLSNFRFQSDVNNEFKPEDSYHLISIINQPSLGGFYKKTSVRYILPSGSYDQLIFHVGVDSKRNQEGPYDGDLDFSWNMNWSWSGDYIFFKHEGEFGESDEQGKYIFHLAGKESYKQVVIDLPKNLEIVQDEEAELNVYVNMNEFFSNPHTIDLDTDNATMAAGSELGNKLAQNYTSLFSLERE